ncbi:MAG: MFS transporter [Gammaproteobacteria bacterium]|nr:MFS transporter [Gammaproteobacteria bacterium]
MRDTNSAAYHLPATDWRAILLLANVMAIRMLGLFMVFPVLAAHTDSLLSATPALIGLALGIYGFTQALLQIPLGRLSDRIGRRPVIMGGLLVFALGSWLAADATSIWGVVAGRAIQGAGAISAAVTALLADLTPAQYRTRAMAVLGIHIGAAFMLAMVLGPIIAGQSGLRGVFVVTAALAILGMLLVAFISSPAALNQPTREAVGSLGPAGLFTGPLIKLISGIFLLHFILTGSFLVLPPLLVEQVGMPAASHWRFYLPVLGASLLITGPLILFRERYSEGGGGVVVAAFGLLAAAQLALALVTPSWIVIALVMVVFFGAFNFLEAYFPSEIAGIAPSESRGEALGAYATAQFLGAFAGGLVGGWLVSWAGAGVALFLHMFLILAWIMAFGLRFRG